MWRCTRQGIRQGIRKTCRKESNLEKESLEKKVFPSKKQNSYSAVTDVVGIPGVVWETWGGFSTPLQWPL